MTGVDLKDAVTRLVDAAMGVVPDAEIIEILEGRIGVVQARSDERDDCDEGEQEADAGDCSDCGTGLTLDGVDGSHYCAVCGLEFASEEAE